MIELATLFDMPPRRLLRVNAHRVCARSRLTRQRTMARAIPARPVRTPAVRADFAQGQLADAPAALAFHRQEAVAAGRRIGGSAAQDKPAIWLKKSGSGGAGRGAGS